MNKRVLIQIQFPKLQLYRVKVKIVKFEPNLKTYNYEKSFFITTFCHYHFLF